MKQTTKSINLHFIKVYVFHFSHLNPQLHFCCFSRTNGLLVKAVVGRYGEQLKVKQEVKERMMEASLVLVVGSSLAVKTAQGFVRGAPKVAIINRGGVADGPSERRARAANLFIDGEADVVLSAVACLLDVAPARDPTDASVPFYDESDASGGASGGCSAGIGVASSSGAASEGSISTSPLGPSQQPLPGVRVDLPGGGYYFKNLPAFIGQNELPGGQDLGEIARGERRNRARQKRQTKGCSKDTDGCGDDGCSISVGGDDDVVTTLSKSIESEEADTTSLADDSEAALLELTSEEKEQRNPFSAFVRWQSGDQEESAAEEEDNDGGCGGDDGISFGFSDDKADGSAFATPTGSFQNEPEGKSGLSRKQRKQRQKNERKKEQRRQKGYNQRGKAAAAAACFACVGGDVDVGGDEGGEGNADDNAEDHCNANVDDDYSSIDGHVDRNGVVGVSDVSEEAWKEAQRELHIDGVPRQKPCTAQSPNGDPVAMQIASLRKLIELLGLEKDETWAWNGKPCKSIVA